MEAPSGRRLAAGCRRGQLKALGAGDMRWEREWIQDEPMVRNILGRQLGRSRSEDFEDALSQVKVLHWKLWCEDPHGMRPKGYVAVAIRNRAAAIGEQIRTRAAREHQQVSDLALAQREARSESSCHAQAIAIDEAANQILELIAAKYGLVYLGITVARMQGCTFPEVGARYGHTAGWARRRWFFLRHKLLAEFPDFDPDF